MKEHFEKPYTDAGFESEDDFVQQFLVTIYCIEPQVLKLDGLRLTFPVQTYARLQPYFKVPCPWSLFASEQGCLQIVPWALEAFYCMSKISRSKKRPISVQKYTMFLSKNSGKLTLPDYLCGLVGIRKGDQIVLCGGGSGNESGLGGELSGLAWLEVWELRKKNVRDEKALGFRD